MMPLKAFLCLGLALGSAALGAVVTEDSASANALSGITLLSSSVSDFALSPTIIATGLALSSHFPFSMPENAVYSLATGFPLGPCIISSGAAYLGNDDYRWQDFHLGLACHYRDFALGWSEHLAYEKFSTGNSYHDWTGNLALSYRGEALGGEFKLLKAGGDDSEYHFAASYRIVSGVQAAAAYVLVPEGISSYRMATTAQIGDLFELITSWQNDPSRFGAGLKFSYEAGELMYAIRTHPDLSLSHSLDIGFRW